MSSAYAMDDRLHKAKDGKAVEELLKVKTFQPTSLDRDGDAAIHKFVKKGQFEHFMALLVHGNLDENSPEHFDINQSNSDGCSALHLAVQNKKQDFVNALLAFGAEVNTYDKDTRTPVDIALRIEDWDMVHHLSALGGLCNVYGDDMNRYETEENDSDSMPKKLNEYTDGKLRIKLWEGACNESNFRSPLSSLSDTNLAAAVQFRDLHSDNLLTSLSPSTVQSIRGERILCLDGGGMKGLMQIEVLLQIEFMTGKRITELFDWIVGTSTGGIVALGMVYANMSLVELRRLYFEMRVAVFSGKDPKLTSQSIETVFKNVMDEKTKMSDVKSPRVLITAVDGRTTALTLRFFNNCFNDDYSDELVWKVARYTSAAPGLFESKDGLVDGGVRANNPSDYALTRIQKYLNDKALDMGGHPNKIACLVSVGCGNYPPEDFGEFNPQNYLYRYRWALSPLKFKREVEELIKFLATALTESEGVADNCRSRCKYQNILFYRFSPELDEMIPLNENDDAKLCRMILKAKILHHSMRAQFEELVLACLKIKRQ